MRITTTAITLALLLVAAPVLAQDRPTDWTLWGSMVDFQSDNDLGDGFTVESDSGTGLGLSANFFVSPRFSIEASVFSLQADSEMFFEPFGTDDDAAFDMGSIEMIPVTLGLQYHFVADSRWDPYIGVGGAWISTSDIESDDLDTLGVGAIEVDDEFSYYGNLGLGYRFGDQLGVAFDVRYLQYEPTTTSKVTGATEDLDLSSLVASIGLRVRF